MEKEIGRRWNQKEEEELGRRSPRFWHRTRASPPPPQNYHHQSTAQLGRKQKRSAGSSVMAHQLRAAAIDNRPHVIELCKRWWIRIEEKEKFPCRLNRSIWKCRVLEKTETKKETTHLSADLWIWFIDVIGERERSRPSARQIPKPFPSFLVTILLPGHYGERCRLLIFYQSVLRQRQATFRHCCTSRLLMDLFASATSFTFTAQ